MSAEHLEEVARQYGFVKRASKITAKDFMDLLLYHPNDNGMVSLNDYSMSMRLDSGIDVSKEGINKRFNAEAVAFVKALLQEQFEYQLSTSVSVGFQGMFSRFAAIRIKDSVSWQLPENLADEYPGSTGGASGAVVRIAFEYDILKNAVLDTEVYSGKQADVKDAIKKIDDIEQGELIIRDLGYFKKDLFKQVIDKKAYFLSRLKPKTHVYVEKDGERKKLDIKEVYDKMKKDEQQRAAYEVYLTEKDTDAIRLIVELLPEDVVREKLRVMAKNAKKKGRPMSEEYKMYAWFGLYITNIPAEWVPAEQIRNLYRVRWQIELRFKAFKSYVKLAKIKKMNHYRFECYLYGLLLQIMINWQMGSHFAAKLWEAAKVMLSILKFFKTVQAHKQRQRLAMKDPGSLLIYVMDMLYLCCRYMKTENRKDGMGINKILNAIH